MELLAAVALAFVFAAVVAIVALSVVDVKEIVWKHALPETKAKFTPKVDLRKPTPIAERADVRKQQWETDQLYRAIISGLPVGFQGDEHEVTLEIYRRVFLMVIDPMQKELADAKEAQQAQVGWFQESRGRGEG